MKHILSLTLLIASPIMASEMPELRSWQPEASVNFSVSRFAPGTYKHGFGGQTGITLNPHFALVAEADYTPLKTVRYFMYGENVGHSGLSLLTVHGGGKANILTHGRFIPYVVGTAGLLQVRESSIIRMGSSSAGYADSEGHLGITVGGGMLVRLTRNLDFKTDFRGLRATSSGSSWLARGTVGFGFRF